MFWVLKITISLRRLFECPQHMFWSRNKKKHFYLHTLILKLDDIPWDSYHYWSWDIFYHGNNMTYDIQNEYNIKHIWASAWQSPSKCIEYPGKTQISWAINTNRSDSSLCTYRGARGLWFIHDKTTSSDQPMLIWVFLLLFLSASSNINCIAHVAR